jgi:hypothetical protein
MEVEPEYHLKVPSSDAEVEQRLELIRNDPGVNCEPILLLINI